MPPPPRLAPLWRSGTGRLRLALRPKTAAAGVTTTTTATATATTTTSARKLSTAPRSAMLAAAASAASRRMVAVRTPAVFGAVRGYADDATTTPPPPRDTSDDAAEARVPSGDAQSAAAAPSAAFSSSSSSPPTTTAASSSSSSQPSPPAESASYAPPTSPENAEALRQLERLVQGLPLFDAKADGHKWGLTTATARPSAVPSAAEGGDGRAGEWATTALAPQTRKVQDRYDPAISQLTRLLMRDGKLAKAQRDMAMLLQYLQTAPPPKLHAVRRLLPGHPPAHLLPLDPARYLTLVVDSVAPLLRIHQLAKMAGGGRPLPVPYPMAARQRRRTAFVWLLDVVRKRPSRGSGRTMLAHRIGEEVVAVAEGRSSLWDKRDQVHRQGTTARANLAALNAKRM